LRAALPARSWRDRKKEARDRTGQPGRVAHSVIRGITIGYLQKIIQLSNNQLYSLLGGSNAKRQSQLRSRFCFDYCEVSFERIAEGDEASSVFVECDY